MVSPLSWFRYLVDKYDFSIVLSLKRLVENRRDPIAMTDVMESSFKNLFRERMTCLHWDEGEEMAPTIGTQRGTLLLRKLPLADPRCRVFVGDVMLLKDPQNTDNYLVRKVVAVEGYEMVSKDEKDEPFILEKGQCWVLADNENLKAKEANDSRTFGPVPITDFVGRVIYCFRTAVDHGRVQNSHRSMNKDFAVLEVELDVDDMAKNHKAYIVLTCGSDGVCMYIFHPFSFSN